jgi:FHS family L-fucose permease-like MFS transporter
VSIPAAEIVARVGFMRTAVIGLLLMTAGCLLFIPASSTGLFVTFLIALFVLAAGITVVQVVANPLIFMLGRVETVHSRLTFAQAFNALGTTIFPFVESILILGPLAKVDVSLLGGSALLAYRSQETRVIVFTYLGLASALVLVAVSVWLRRNRLPRTSTTKASVSDSFNLLRHPRFGFGALCIFLYVGAEVAIGSLIVNYLMQTSVMGMEQQSRGEHVPLYWGGAMVGRFIGAYLLRVFSPGRVLACEAGTVVSLLIISASTTGAVSGWSLLAIGVFNSIMFPTIFSLASEGLGPRAAAGSGTLRADRDPGVI